MDTDAIYSAVCSYGTEKHHGWESDAEDTLSDIKRLLNEADEEHKSLLAENERLVDEVNEARKETSKQARLNGMGAEREARLMAEVAELKAKLAKKASLLSGCYAADHKQKQRIAELEKANEAFAKRQEWWNERMVEMERLLSAAPAAQPECWCTTCRHITTNDMRFVVCPECGNKRCPKAHDHRNACTGSNEPGQPGSSWEHVKEQP